MSSISMPVFGLKALFSSSGLALKDKAGWPFWPKNYLSFTITEKLFFLQLLNFVCMYMGDGYIRFHSQPWPLIIRPIWRPLKGQIWVRKHKIVSISLTVRGGILNFVCVCIGGLGTSDSIISLGL